MGEYLVLNHLVANLKRAQKKPCFQSVPRRRVLVSSGNARLRQQNLAYYADAVVVTINHRLAIRLPARPTRRAD